MVPWIVAIALFMQNLDVTILNSAIPVIAQDLNQYPLNLKFALTSYLVSLGVLIPISGWLSDKYGAKGVLMLGVTIFGLGSLLCGSSFSLEHLVISRIIQGAGGALMVPVCRLILIKTYPKSQLVSATNQATIPSLIGPVLGPSLGGFIVTWFSWRWIFFINIPFCFILLYLASHYVENFKEEKVGKFDIIGFILFAAFLSLTIFLIETISTSFLSNIISIILLTLSFILLGLYFYFTKKIKEPFLDKKLFAIRTFTITILGSFFSRIGIGGIPFLLPMLLQINRGFSPIKSGLYIIFYTGAMLVAKFFIKGILQKIGFRKCLIFNTILLGISISGLLFIVYNSNVWIMATVIFWHGFFTSIQFSCLNVLTYSDLTEDLVSKGTSIGKCYSTIIDEFWCSIYRTIIKVKQVPGCAEYAYFL